MRRRGAQTLSRPCRPPSAQSVRRDRPRGNPRLIVGPSGTTLGVLWPGMSNAWTRGPMTMRYRAYAYTTEADRRQRLEADVRRGLTASPKTLPSKYFYDAIGSKLFEDITRVPEYYLTRTEAKLLETLAPELMLELAPVDIVELGAGSPTKTRLLLDARDGLRDPVRYVTVDVD